MYNLIGFYCSFENLNTKLDFYAKLKNNVYYLRFVILARTDTVDTVVLTRVVSKNVTYHVYRPLEKKISDKRYVGNFGPTGLNDSRGNAILDNHVVKYIKK